MKKVKNEEMRYIQEHPGGYRLRISPTLGRYFSASKYGGRDIALLAAKACRDHYLDSGEFVVPPPLHQTKAELARDLGVSYRKFLAACAEKPVGEVIKQAKEGGL